MLVHIAIINYIMIKKDAYFVVQNFCGSLHFIQILCFSSAAILKVLKKENLYLLSKICERLCSVELLLLVYYKYTVSFESIQK